MPLVSIITINYNNTVGLQKTIASVATQAFDDVEYIIIDGGSADGSAEIIKQQAPHIHYWVSEKDRGIYHAMNKGIDKATGEYLLFLNSGDYLVSPDTLQTIASDLHTYDFIYGDLLIDGMPDRYPDKLNFNYFYKHGTLPHQAAFIRRELLVKYGKYDESLKICADTIFFINVLCKHNATYRHIHTPISQINLNGISAQPQNWNIIQKEITTAFKNDYSMFVDDYHKMNELAGMVKRSRLLKGLRKMGLLKHIHE